MNKSIQVRCESSSGSLVKCSDQWITQVKPLAYFQPRFLYVTDTHTCNNNDIGENLPTIKAHAVLYTTSTDGNSNLGERNT